MASLRCLAPQPGWLEGRVSLSLSLSLCLGLPYMTAGSQGVAGVPEERSPSSSPQIFMQLLNNHEYICLCSIKLTIFLSPTSTSSIHHQEFLITSDLKEENRMLCQHPYFLFHKRGKNLSWSQPRMGHLPYRCQRIPPRQTICFQI